jgi:D-3-phosphoglycerate dehydrogenase
MNTPAGNTVTTAELTFTMILSLARKVPQAHASMAAGKWDRKSFSGIELAGKTLGVLGMGRIGGEVAKRALAFGMKVVAYDPFLTEARAQAMGVQLAVDLDAVYRQADFITVHMPVTKETKEMLTAAAFAKMKPGVRIVNCARGEIINEADLIAALESNKVAGAALDVFAVEPLPADHPYRKQANLILTPHLGASTEEAQAAFAGDGGSSAHHLRRPCAAVAQCGSGDTCDFARLPLHEQFEGREQRQRPQRGAKHRRHGGRKEVG